MTYRSYIGKVDYDDEAETFFGTVVNANVLISFRGRTVEELKKSFHDLVDSYLEDCRESGVPPEKPYNGSIMVRVDPAIHRRLAIKASERHESMNRFLQNLIEKATEDVSEAPAPAKVQPGRRTATTVKGKPA